MLTHLADLSSLTSGREVGVHAGFWHIVQLSRSPELPLLMSVGPMAKPATTRGFRRDPDTK